MKSYYSTILQEWTTNQIKTRFETTELFNTVLLRDSIASRRSLNTEPLSHLKFIILILLSFIQLSLEKRIEICNLVPYHLKIISCIVSHIKLSDIPVFLSWKYLYSTCHDRNRCMYVWIQLINYQSEWGTAVPRTADTIVGTSERTHRPRLSTVIYFCVSAKVG